MEAAELLMVRQIPVPEGEKEECYYSRSLYFDELYVAKRVSGTKISWWLTRNGWTVGFIVIAKRKTFC
jgi:hypothetical protein